MADRQEDPQEVANRIRHRLGEWARNAAADGMVTSRRGPDAWAILLAAAMVVAAAALALAIGDGSAGPAWGSVLGLTSLALTVSAVLAKVGLPE